MPHSVEAQEHTAVVLVLDAASEVSAELLATVALQLPSVEVRSRRAPLSGDLALDLPVASMLLREEDAMLGVWIRWSRPGTALLYVVGGPEDIALVRVVEVTGEPGPDLDRALALTIAELLDSILDVHPLAPEESDGLDLAAVAPVLLVTPPPSPEAAPALLPEEPVASPHWMLALELGALGSVSLEPGFASLAGRFALAAGYGEGIAKFEVALAFEVAAPVFVSAANTLIDLRGLGPGVEFRALAVLDSTWTLGGNLGVGLRFLELSAEARDGRRTALEVAVATLSLGGELRAAFMPQAEVRLGLGLEVSTERRRFSVDGEIVLDLGLFRPLGALTLVVTVP